MQKKHGELYNFIRAQMAADPKPYGSKERALKAAAEKFGGSKNLDRTTIQRRIKLLEKRDAVVRDCLPLFKEVAAHLDELMPRFKAAFSAVELAELENVGLPFAETILEDREELQRLRTRRRNPAANK